MSIVEKKVLNIYKIGENETIDYSGEELKKYLCFMCQDTKVNIVKRDKYDNALKDGLWIGLCSEFTDEELFKVENITFDDAIMISVKQGKGIISGVNFRSILIGVYRFLTECGCRFIRPGADGEYIPKVPFDSLNVELSHKAAYRHRGICIEGAVSYENVFDIIEWCPKVGFNSYFIQFREAYIFFERWYKHINNTEIKAEDFPVDSARKIVKKLEIEIKKRGLLYHAVGHGWTCGPLGFSGLGWYREDISLQEEVKPYLAMVNGKRELWNGVPLDTNLCYSNQKVQELIIENIVDYLTLHNNVDVLHFWLADGTNNQCECENCRGTRPSDFYVQMLNKLDERLTEKGIKTKIVFLIYVDLFWPPEKEGIKNTERFIMMFAPFDRVYTNAFVPNGQEVSISPYVRNNIERPNSIPKNMAYLNAWQKMFKGDSFDFDYHFMWEHMYDPGYFKIARVLYEDIINLKKIGLNGFISCQLQRTFLPSGLGIYAMGKALWDDTLSFEEIVEEYFEGAFGDKGTKCRVYLENLSNLFYPSYIKERISDIDEKESERFASVVEYISEYKSFIEENVKINKKCHALSFKYLNYHSEAVSLYAEIMEARAKKDINKVNKTWKELRYMLQKEEKNIQPVFDVFQFIETMDSLLKVE